MEGLDPKTLLELVHAGGSGALVLALYLCARAIGRIQQALEILNRLEKYLDSKQGRR